MHETRKFYNIFDLQSMNSVGAGIKVPLGADESGELRYLDFGKDSHVLISGQSGSGKSQLIHTLIRSLVLQNSPSEVNLILIDPKGTELEYYENQKLPHILLPVVRDYGWYGAILKWNVLEMKVREELFAKTGVSNVNDFNKKSYDSGNGVLPRIFIFIDECVEVLTNDPHQTESYVNRIAQLGMTYGIHIVLASSDPGRVSYIHRIKDNIPSRIALKVPAEKDSMLIIGVAGAERLSDRGDMLFRSVDSPKPLRLQGLSIDPGTIKQLVSELKY